MQRILKESHALLEHLADRGEERVPIVEALLADYKDDVYFTPPQQVLVNAIQDLRNVLTTKQLHPSSHSTQSNSSSSSTSEASLLDLPCVLEDFELNKLKGMMKKKPKESNIPSPTLPAKNAHVSVEVVLEKVVKYISAILYVCQIPLEIFDSCFVVEQDPVPVSAPKNKWEMNNY